MQYLRARYYDSESGRFTVVDTYLGDISQLLTLNRYSYVVNNPVMQTDASGHTAKWLSSAVSAVKNTASKAVSTVKNTASKAVSAVKNTASKAVSAVKNTASKAVSAVKNTAGKVVKAVKSTATKAVTAVKIQRRP